MRQTDYGTVACWQERNLLAKIDRDLKQQSKQHTKDEQVAWLKKHKVRCGGM